MKKFNIEIIIDAPSAQLARMGVTGSEFAGQKVRAWDFNTMSDFGLCAKIWHFYNEDEYYQIPMKYIRFCLDL